MVQEYIIDKQSAYQFFCSSSGNKVTKQVIEGMSRGKQSFKKGYIYGTLLMNIFQYKWKFKDFKCDVGICAFSIQLVIWLIHFNYLNN